MYFINKRNLSYNDTINCDIIDIKHGLNNHNYKLTTPSLTILTHPRMYWSTRGPHDVSVAVELEADLMMMMILMLMISLLSPDISNVVAKEEIGRQKDRCSLLLKRYPMVSTPTPTLLLPLSYILYMLSPHDRSTMLKKLCSLLKLNSLIDIRLNKWFGNL